VKKKLHVDWEAVAEARRRLAEIAKRRPDLVGDAGADNTEGWVRALEEAERSLAAETTEQLETPGVRERRGAGEGWEGGD
jgi:hypothetical protein